MTKNDAISHYNRLEGVSKIILDLKGSRDITQEYVGELNDLLNRVTVAQKKLPWNPDNK